MTDPPRENPPRRDQAYDPADALKSMADGEHREDVDVDAPVGGQTTDARTDAGDHETDDAMAAFAQAAGPSGEAVDLDEAFGGADEEQSAANRARARRQAGNLSAKSFKPTKFHFLLIRLSVVMGILLIVPGVLGLGVLLRGVLPFDVPLARKEHATAFAVLMLMCWPVAACLLIGASYFSKQLRLIESRHHRR